jgi:conjugal transfer mating pair stabilization protein TraN
MALPIVRSSLTRPRGSARACIAACLAITGLALPPASAGPAEDFADGKALGNASKNQSAAGIRSGTAKATLQGTLPGYTDTPPQTGLAGNVDLSGAAAAQRVLCARKPNDASCAGQGVATAARPRQWVGGADPALAGGPAADNPTAILGNIAATYSACTTTTPGVTSAGTSTTQTCTLDTNAWSRVGCSKVLTVLPRDTQPSCAPGTWYANGTVDKRPGDRWDHMYVAGLCENRLDERMQFRVWATGKRGACAGWQTFTLDMSWRPGAAAATAEAVASVRPHWGGSCVATRVTAFGPGCDPAATDGTCRKTFRFAFGGETWDIPLVFKRPSGQQLAGDYWNNGCAALEARTPAWGRPPDGTNVVLTEVPALSQLAPDYCVRTASRCVDGPGTRMIDGLPVTRECWQWANTFDCSGNAVSSTCSAAAQGGCLQTGTGTCLASDAYGHCLSRQVPFSCPAAAPTYTAAVNCPTASFCTGGSCYDKRYPPDADFAKSVAYLEAGREAGRGIDPANLRVFNGYASQCRSQVNLVLNNCCKSNGSSGAGAFNTLGVASTVVGTVGKAVFSTYTYDALFLNDAPAIVLQGFEALAGTGYSSTLAGVLSGNIGVEEFMQSLVPGPWTAALLAVQVLMILSECDQNEMITAMKKDARLCVELGEYCSKKAILGVCLDKKQSYCCFNSRLSRIINEQGRAQLGKDFGAARSPQCAGFTLDELQRLDFSRMDLTEFLAEIVPTLPNPGSEAGRNAGKVNNCYYGAGKC